ncbi:MAG: hypothetical protein IIB88_04015 [Chloroflexi bacterium]|nr:hypothetical protein [Chloroflexota bacterium]
MAAFRVFLIAVALTAPVWALHATTVSACTFSLRDNVRAADLIAVGRIDDIRVLPAESDPLLEEFDLTPVEIQLAVSDYLKGVGSEDLLVYRTAVDLTYEGDRLSGIFTSRTDCGRAVGLGEHCVWLLAHRDSTHYETITPAGCTADQSAAAINADGIRQLLEEQATTAPTVVSLGDVGTGPTGSGSEFQWLLAATAGSGAAMLLAGAALRRRTF